MSWILPCVKFHVRRPISFGRFFVFTITAWSGFTPGSSLFGQALPSGGSVSAGKAVITQPSATQLNITQTSPNAVVNWQNFSIGSGNTVTITQPGASSALLNRVTGNTPSAIAGSLNANGQVFLVNPNGIEITKNGVVNATGGFAASTLGISDQDFMAGKYDLTGNGTSNGVGNAGAVTVGRGGYAVLLGGTVSNSGKISVPLGKIGLGSGEAATLDFSGDGFLQVAVPTQAGGKSALVQNKGTLRANGGSVMIEAATAQTAARNAVNISGLVQARTIQGHNGSIEIGGGEGGTVKITGTLDASSKRNAGGAIAVTGKTIKLKGALVDASGGIGGGTINIGGGRHGTGPLPAATSVSIDKTTLIKANATKSGNGGDVVVWSTGATTLRGAIDATGGATGGNGGSIEISSLGILDFRGTVDTLAPAGQTGSLLLDPYNVTIQSASGTPSASCSSGTCTPSGSNSILTASALETALGSANVTVTTGSSGTDAGTITVNNALTWNTNYSLTLSAANTITLNAPIAALNGGLTLNAGLGQTIAGNSAINVAAFNITQGNWVQNSASLAPFSASSFTIGPNASFLRAAGGSGTPASPYLITDVYGLQGIGSSAAYLADSFTLANDIDASGTSSWNSGQGFVPIGNTSTAGYSGTFNGQNYAVTSLNIDLPAITTGAGLFGYTSGATIKNVSVLNADVTGSGGIGSGTGALIGAAENSTTVSNVVTTGSVTSSATGGSLFNIGGIIGDLGTGSSLTYGASSANVTSTFTSTGGAIGAIEAGSTASYVSATGAVSGLDTSNVGGLAGYLAGTLSNGYATGSVSGPVSTAVGGLVGTITSGASLANSYAVGAVSGYAQAGGLAGSNSGTITSSYWDKTTSGTSIGTGSGSSSGATGYSTAAMQIQSNYAGWDFSNLWFLPTTGLTAEKYPILRGGTTMISGANLTVSTGSDSSTAVNTSTLQQRLAYGNALLTASSGGTITVANPVTWSSSGNLALWAAGSLTVNSAANMTATGSGSLNLIAETGRAAVTSAALSVASGNLAIMAPNAGTSIGVFLTNSTIAAGTGTGSIAGTSDGGVGVEFSGTNALSASGPGSLNITGSDPTAIGLSINGGSLNTSGTVTLTGSANGPAASYGIYLGYSNAVTDLSGNLQFRAWSEATSAFWINTGTNTLTNSGTGTLAIIASGLGSGYALAGFWVDGGTTTLSNTSTGSLIVDATGSGNGSTSHTSGAGLWINGATLALSNTATGTLAITGNSTASNAIGLGADSSVTSAGTVTVSGIAATGLGINLLGGASISDTSGTFTATGTSASGVGLQINGTAALSNSGTGSLNLSGTSNGSGDGFQIASAGGLTTAGTVNLRGTSSTGSGIDFLGTNTVDNSSGALTLIADSMTLAGTISGTGTSSLTIEPATAAASIGIGASQTGTLALGATSLAAIQAGFGSLVIGSPSGSGAISVGSWTANAPLTIQSPSGTGSITLNGALATGTGGSAGPVTLLAGGSISSASGSSLTTQNEAINVTGQTISGAVDIASNGGPVTLTPSGNGTLSGIISGAGGVTMAGTGILTFSGLNTYTGATSVAAGTLDIGTAGSLGSGAYSGAISIASGSMFDYSSSAAQTLSGVISGAGALTKDTSAASVLTLSGASTYAGATTVNAGTLNLSGSLNVGNGNTETLSVSSGAALSGTGTVTAGALNASGTGTVSLTGSNMIGALSTTGTAGAITLVDAAALTVGAFNGTSLDVQTTGSNHAITFNGGVVVSGTIAASTASGNVTINSGATLTANGPAGALVIQAGTGTAAGSVSGGDFVNNQGPAALSTPASGAYWAVYTGDLPGSGTNLGSLSANNWRYDTASLFTPVSAIDSVYYRAAPILTVTAASQSRQYGATPNLSQTAFSVTGEVAGNGVSNDTQSASLGGSPSLSAAATAASPVAGGPYAITAAAGTISNPFNYQMSYAAGGSLTVTPAPLTVTANSPSMTYGASSLPTLAASYSGFVNGDTAASLTTAPSVTTTATAYNGAAGSASSVGTYPVTVSGAAAANYTINYGAGSLTVTPLPVMLTGTQTYNGATAITAVLSASNKIAGDVLDITGTATGTLASANAGAEAISTLAGLSLSNSNYTLTGGSGAVTVTPLPVTLTGTQTYNGSTSILAANLSLSNLVGGTNAGLSGTGSVASPNVSAGTQALNLTGLAVSNTNYTLIGGSGTASITPLPVMLTGTQSYNGSTAITAALSASNKIAGDTLDVTGTATGTLASAKSGSEAMSTLAGLSLSNSNYTLTGGSGAVTVESPVAPASTGGSTAAVSPTLSSNSSSSASVSVATAGVEPNSGNGNSLAAPSSPALTSASTGPASSDPASTSSGPAPAATAKTAPDAVKAPAAASSPALTPASGSNLAGSGDRSMGGRFAGNGPETNVTIEAGGSIANPNTAATAAPNFAPAQKPECCTAKRMTAKPAAASFFVSPSSRSAFYQSIDHGISEARNARNTIRAAAEVTIAGTGLAVTAGIMAWLLRGGALLSTLMSSIPLVRGFDPLMVVLPAERTGGFGPSSSVDLMFEESRSHGPGLGDPE